MDDERDESLMSNQAADSRSAPFLGRRCACGGIIGPDGECAECRRKRLDLQRRPQTRSQGPPVEKTSVADVVYDVIRAAGQPLDAETRSFFEPRFRYDFSQVRVHTGSKASDSARAVHAHAYTIGRNIVFGDGQHAPETAAGKKLLSHELTHVIQQDAKSEFPTRFEIGKADDSNEAEAHQNAQQILDANGKISSEPTRRDSIKHSFLLQRTCAANPLETFYRSAANYCKDTPGTSQLHPGQTCYREVPVRSSYWECPPGDQVCFDQDGKCHDSWDLASPVEERDPDGTCNLHGLCSLAHADKDKVVETWLDQKFGGPSGGGPLDCTKQCEDLPWYSQGFCYLGCSGGPFPM